MTTELILITAPGCAPCKALKPILLDIAAERQLNFRICEATPEPANVATIQKYKVRNVPTLLHVDAAGEEITRFMGGMTRGEAEAKLAEWGL